MHSFSPCGYESNWLNDYGSEDQICQCQCTPPLSDTMACFNVLNRQQLENKKLSYCRESAHLTSRYRRVQKTIQYV